jgi:hypothetical protein
VDRLAALWTDWRSLLPARSRLLYSNSLEHDDDGLWGSAVSIQRASSCRYNDDTPDGWHFQLTRGHNANMTCSLFPLTYVCNWRGVLSLVPYVYVKHHYCGHSNRAAIIRHCTLFLDSDMKCTVQPAWLFAVTHTTRLSGCEVPFCSGAIASIVHMLSH